ncbi:MAG: hypothetical protein HKP14_00720 [Bacteroidia bacterium]|nr:hypothetical protein [Bacteroidia bacterium]
MKNIKLLSLLIFAISVITFSSCSDDDPDPEPTPVETKTTYDGAAKAVIDGNCATSGCHTSGAMIGSLEGYADANTFAGYGRMLGAVKHEMGYSPMPKNSAKLSDTDIATLESWINDGLLEK